MPRPASAAVLPLCVLTVSTLLIGCGANMVPAGVSEANAVNGISGSVHGGSQAISGATVALYAPATNGYGNTPSLIVSAIAPTDSNGGFAFPSSFTCPANSGNVYLTATGGNPGAGSGANTAIALAVLLGPCNGLTSSTQVKINEATTVAAAFSLAQFATVSNTGTGIGTSSTNLVGLNNAYGTASKLVSTSTGAPNAATSLPGIVLPTAEVNTLANILAYCVNTSASGGNCTSLLTAATPPQGIQPKDTFQAAIDIALNPTNNVPTLFGLTSSYTPFQTGLATAPADFTLGIQYNGSVLSTCAFTNGVAIDQTGNAWVGCGTGNANAGVTEISPLGTYLSPASGFALPLPTNTPVTGGNGLAIDANGAAWLTNASENAVYQISASGSANRFAPSGDLNGPTGIAINNGTSKVYVANTGNTPSANNGSADYLGTSVAILNLSGTLSSLVTPLASLIYGPTDIVNGNSNYVVADFTSYNTNSGAVPTIDVFAPTDNGTLNAYGSPSQNGDLAEDAAANIWYINNGSILQFAALPSSGTYYYTPTAVTIAPAINPISVMFDGNDHLLIAGTNTSSQGRIAFYDDSANLLYTLGANNTIPAVPYDPTGLDIDASGNIWITGAPTSGAGFLTELVGAAAPVPMPKSAAGLLSKVGTRP